MATLVTFGAQDSGAGVLDTDLSASMTAGLLLLARPFLAHLNLPRPTASDILHATGTRASQSYARRSILSRLAKHADRPAGRPPVMAQPATAAVISQRVLRFVMENPGAVYGSSANRHYSVSFRHFVLGLRAEFPQLSVGVFAEAAQVPPSSLRSWLRGRCRSRSIPSTPISKPPTVTSRAITSLVQAWMSWRGPLTRFCEHVQRNLGLPWKRALITKILVECGLHGPKIRKRRKTNHARWRSFQTFFPGAQWVTDGKVLTLRINGHAFPFSVQFMVDTCSGAIVGASLRDHEDSRAVLKAFNDAVATTGAPPLALLLDNRPCNHSAAVARLAPATSLIYAARGRPQTKGHVEGAFGLFSQTMPQLELRADNLRELARQFLYILVQGWARAVNHRPRRDRSGRSRVELYQSACNTPAAREAADAVLRKRAERSARMHAGRRCQTASQNAMHAYFAERLAQLAIPDPDGAAARTLCHRPLDAVLAGLAVWEGKRDAGTLPVDASADYLLGIIRNLVEHDEGLRIAEALWRMRVTTRSHLEALVDARMRAAAADGAEDHTAFDTLTDEAMAASNPTERRLCLMAAARTLRHLSLDQKNVLYRRAARRIHASPNVSYAQQLEAVRFLAAESVPLL